MPPKQCKKNNIRKKGYKNSSNNFNEKNIFLCLAREKIMKKKIKLVCGRGCDALLNK